MNVVHLVSSIDIYWTLNICRSDI